MQVGLSSRRGLNSNLVSYFSVINTALKCLKTAKKKHECMLALHAAEAQLTIADAAMALG